MLNLEQSPTIRIVRRPDRVTRLVVIARRWVVERTFAWLGPRTLPGKIGQGLGDSNLIIRGMASHRGHS